MCFDNSYSYFKNKKIQYSVSLTPPMNDTEKLVEETTESTDITSDLEAIAAIVDWILCSNLNNHSLASGHHLAQRQIWDDIENKLLVTKLFSDFC